MPDLPATSATPAGSDPLGAAPVPVDRRVRDGAAMDDARPGPRHSPGRRPVRTHGAAVLHLELHLSRDPASVGLARRILGAVLQVMTIDQRCRDELVLALSEGCTNAVQHAVDADGYEVRVSFDDGCCTVDILDSGRHVRWPPADRLMPRATAEGGRGLSIMAMSTDSLYITPRRPHGLAVRFTKRLV